MISLASRKNCVVFADLFLSTAVTKSWPVQTLYLPKVTTMIGQRRGLSAQDIKDLNILYGCKGKSVW